MQEHKDNRDADLHFNSLGAVESRNGSIAAVAKLSKTAAASVEEASPAKAMTQNSTGTGWTTKSMIGEVFYDFCHTQLLLVGRKAKASPTCYIRTNRQMDKHSLERQKSW